MCLVCFSIVFGAEGTDAKNGGDGGGSGVWALLVLLGCVFFVCSCFASLLCLRFLSDPNLGGCEKVIISAPVSNMCTKKPNFKATDVTGDGNAKSLVAPMSLLIVKGWTRSFAAWVVMVAMYESEAILQASRPFFVYQLFLGLDVSTTLGFKQPCQAAPDSLRLCKAQTFRRKIAI